MTIFRADRQNEKKQGTDTMVMITQSMRKNVHIVKEMYVMTGKKKKYLLMPVFCYRELERAIKYSE